MTLAGATRICIVISPDKGDIVSYFGGKIGEADVCYAVQPGPAGLCDALFRAIPFIQDNEPVLVGLPDTVWFPIDGLTQLPSRGLSFLLFPVDHPELFDAVVCDAHGRVQRILVKREAAPSHWIWGAFRLDGRLLRELASLWERRERRDAYVGTLVNAWIDQGGEAVGVRAGTSYVDVGTLHGYREAIRLLARPISRPSAGEVE
jgi:dTDP-glucose pyrophosphorylase